MTDASWPTEAMATVAVDAAARNFYETNVTVPEGGSKPSFDDLPATAKLQFRQAVLPIVWAALSALPDPRRVAWFEGYHFWYNNDLPPEHRDYGEGNPYPSGGTDD